MDNPYLITALLILVGVALCVFGEWLYKHLTRERGPWVVTRVGVGGREFYMTTDYYHVRWWTPDVKNALTMPTLRIAEKWADALLADVAPLSKYTGVDRG